MPIFRPGPLHVVTAGSMSALAKIERLELLPAVIEAMAAPWAVFDELYGRGCRYEFVERIDAVNVPRKHAYSQFSSHST